MRPRNLGSPAGGIDSQFGSFNPRTVPIDLLVTLTSTYDADTGYSWSELRGRRGVGAVVPDLPQSGDQAYEFTGRVDLQPGTLCRAFMDRDQTIYWLLVLEEGGGSGSGLGGLTSGCGWFTGMRVGDCLRVSVDGDQTDLYLTTADAVTWASATPVTICGTQYTVSVAKNTGGVPTLSLTNGGTTAGQWDGCGCAFAKFAFNLQDLCPSEAWTGSPCSNVVEVRVDWSCCPIAGWAGAGYYCVIDAGGDCGSAAPVELTDADRCDTTIEICSGPYATLEEAQAVCTQPNDVTNLGLSSCGVMAEPLQVGILYRATITVSGGFITDGTPFYDFGSFATGSYHLDITGVTAAGVLSGRFGLACTSGSNIAEGCNTITLAFTDNIILQLGVSSTDGVYTFDFTLSAGAC